MIIFYFYDRRSEAAFGRVMGCDQPIGKEGSAEAPGVRALATGIQFRVRASRVGHRWSRGPGAAAVK